MSGERAERKGEERETYRRSAATRGRARLWGGHNVWSLETGQSGSREMMGRVTGNKEGRTAIVGWPLLLGHLVLVHGHRRRRIDLGPALLLSTRLCEGRRQTGVSRRSWA